MRRTSFVAATVVVAACSAFGADPASPTTSDAGAATDADVANEVDAAVVDAGPPFCSFHEGSLFCDDFERSPRDLEKGPWDDIIGDTPAAMSFGEGFSSPTGVRIRPQLRRGESRFWQNRLTVPATGFRWSFRLKLNENMDTLGPDQGNLNFAALDYDTGPIVFTLYENGTAGRANSTLFNENIDLAFDNSLPRPIKIGAWMQLAVEVSPLTEDANELRFSVDGRVVLKAEIAARPSPAIRLGGEGDLDGVKIDMSFDDVLVTPL